jgi:hypothetical protein
VDVPASGHIFERTAIASAAMLAAINVWTGAPLFAVWAAARLQGGTKPEMSSAFAVVGILAVLELALVAALTRLGRRYDELTGRPIERQTAPWLRSMRGESDRTARTRVGVSAVERIVTISVAAAVLCFEVWFFFYAGSPI